MDYGRLLKPRVMSLVVFTGLVGLVAAPGTVAPYTALIAIACIAIGAGAAGALNMWYDRDIDSVMARTRNRPLPAGRVSAAEALVLGSVLAAGAVAVMAITVNGLAAALLAVTVLFYVLVYTMWLKRRTPQNIVIGGAAGALPPVIGWAAATGAIGLMPLALFAIIFLWTPPHFWALALVRSGDYERAGVPMMPVVRGRQATRRQIMLYAVLLAPASLAPLALGAGWFYGASAVVLNLMFIRAAWRIWRTDDAGHARRLFGFSILYLFLIFAILMAESLVSGGVA
ncbi:MAG: heme o synthase [Alphaproteobacteria bacterium]